MSNNLKFMYDEPGANYFQSAEETYIKASGKPFWYFDNDTQQLGIIRGPFADLAGVVSDISARSNGRWRWYEFFDSDWNFGYGKVNASN